MVSCALWEFEEAFGWVILNNALAPLVHYSESPTLVPLQIIHNAQLTILYCPNIRPRAHIECSFLLLLPIPRIWLSNEVGDILTVII